jgi:rubrerythrin
MSQTDENLKEAFAGESQANQRYLAFAKKADAEKLPGTARLFRAAAAAETVHAQNHLESMRAAGSTLDNLREAAKGEAAEFKRMYPAFIEQADKDGNEDAKTTFDYANQVEKIHHALYSGAIQAVEEGQDLPETKLFVCRGCGNTVKGEPPKKCPICGAPRSWFMEIE